jgi:predicted CXXCH cytochrome family protein
MLLYESQAKQLKGKQKAICISCHKTKGVTTLF